MKNNIEIVLALLAITFAIMALVFTILDIVKGQNVQ